MKKLICFYLVIFVAVFAFAINEDLETKTANTVTKQNMPVIILDAGHGGFDGGAVSGNILEKDINLNFALEMEPLLRAFGYNVIMTRTTDSGTEDAGLTTIRQKKVSDIRNRLNLIENTQIECFLSMHQNMFSASKYYGTQVFYGPNNDGGKVYAESIQSTVKALLQKENDRAIKPCGKNIFLMYKTTKPAVLVECGFMSNSEELSELQDSNYRGKLNFCILIGILKGRSLNG
ncbi:MAG: N-acetylmuramoyl-L-alanine amidase [Acutalibacteraceae bacterium]